MDNDDEKSILFIDKYENKEWRNKSGKLHRVGGPAIEYVNGNKFWFQNGERHRIDGPAIEYHYGDKDWYIRNKFYHNKEDFFNALTDEEKAIALFSEDFHNA
jgi:hypothetical protein